MSAKPPVRPVGTLKTTCVGDTERTGAACPLIVTLTPASSYLGPDEARAVCAVSGVRPEVLKILAVPAGESMEPEALADQVSGWPMVRSLIAFTCRAAARVLVEITPS